MLLAALVASVLAGGPAGGHPQFALSTVNRYATVVLNPSFGARILYTFMVGDVPAHTLRRQADKNGDGTLDMQEQAGLEQTLKSQLPDLEVTLDGSKVPLQFSAPPLALPDPRVSPLAFSFELTAPLPLTADSSGGPHLLRVDDRISLPPIGDVELRIEEGPGVRVLSSWIGNEPPSTAAAATEKKPVQLLFASQGPPRSSLSDRSVSVRFGSASQPPPRRRSLFSCSGGRF